MIKNKSWLAIIGSFIFLTGIGLISYDIYSNHKVEEDEKNAIEDFYVIHEEKEVIEEVEVKEEEKKPETKKKVEYIAILKIPKINLERGLVDPNSYLNDVKYNVEILDESSMPDEIGGNVILASHSGTARISYFKNLHKLVIGDSISINYKSKIYNYKVVDIYEIDKTGTAEIIRNKNKSTLTLITCKHNSNKQIVVIAEIQ